MNVSSIIQTDVKPIKLSKTAPTEIVVALKVVSNEEKCQLPKLVLSINDKSSSNEVKKSKGEQVASVIESTIKAVGDPKSEKYIAG